MNTRSKYLIAASAAVLALSATGTALAANGHSKPATTGTVSSVNGSTITLTGKNDTTYTVNAGSATITKFTPGSNGAKGTSTTIPLSQVQTGDKLTVFGTTSDNTINATKITDGTFGMMHGGKTDMMRPAVNGVVASINGNTISVTGNNNTTYTVDATNADILKIAEGTSSSKPTTTTITISNIVVGDHIMAMGTLSGTNLSATKIIDGAFPGENRPMMPRPAAVGTVSSINNNIITLTGRNNTTYTVDAANAGTTKFTPGSNGAKGTSTNISLSQVQTGDNLVVEGTASGTNITATKILDGMPMMDHGFGRGHGMPSTTPEQ